MSRAVEKDRREGGGSGERDRRLIAKLINRGVARIRKVSLESYEKALIMHEAVVVTRERMIIASWVRGIFDELGALHLSREIEMALHRGDFVTANTKAQEAIEAYVKWKAAKRG
jgi:hypothetical protein